MGMNNFEGNGKHRKFLSRDMDSQFFSVFQKNKFGATMGKTHLEGKQRENRKASRDVPVAMQ